MAVGPACGTIDIRGIKVDDNNGSLNNGFGLNSAGSGVSNGHMRFTNAAQWATVPVGSLILIYNTTDPTPLKPPADGSDTAPKDSIYVLPVNSPLLEACTNSPTAGTTAIYAGCTVGPGNWLLIGFRNQGDAGQTRDPLGRYFHGISYGPTIQNMNNGGLDMLRISTLDHTGRVIYFNSGNYRLAANFTSALTGGNETPGAVNNTANSIYRAALQCLTVPIELISFTARPEDHLVRCEWITASEQDNDYFTVERSPDGSHFQAVGTMNGAGDSQHERHYIFDDPAPTAGISYYRLRQTDLDGTSALGPIVAVEMTPSQQLMVEPAGPGQLLITGATTFGSWQLIDGAGRLIASGDLRPAITQPIVVPNGAHSLLALVIRTMEQAEVFTFLRIHDGNLLKINRE